MEFLSSLSFVKISIARGLFQTLSRSEKKQILLYDIVISQSDHCSKNLADMSV